MNGKPLYTSLDIVIVYFEMIRKKRCVCVQAHKQQPDHVRIYIYWKKRTRERARERQQQENWISSIKSKVLRCAYLICFRDWTLAKLVRLQYTSILHTSSLLQSMMAWYPYNNVVFCLCFTYLFVENRLEFISNVERPWKLNLLYLLRIEPTNPSEAASRPAIRKSVCAHAQPPNWIIFVWLVQNDI